MSERPQNKNLKPFPKGVSGNPGGRPKAKITIDSVRLIIDKLCMLSRAELQEVIQDPKTTMIELQFASVIAQAAKTGDFSRMSFILDRVIGKVANVNIEGDFNDIKDLSDKELVERIKLKLAEYDEKAG